MKRVANGSAKQTTGKGRKAEALRARGAASGSARMVWRVSAEHPEGAWVDPRRAPLNPAAAPDAHAQEQDSWTTSTMDLLDGVEVVEGAEDTIPAELLEELFETKPKPPTT